MYRSRAFPLFACVALAARVVSAASPFDGTYTGERVLTSGDPGNCIARDPVSVIIHESKLTFTNKMLQDRTIDFLPRADGSFNGITGDRKGDVAVIGGHIGADVLDADVSGPQCTHHWHLAKQH
jgi:hypothetical protein